MASYSGEVDRAALLRWFAGRRGVGLSRETWEVSAILAGLRERANDPIRAVDRDRGAEKNWLADIWGVVGELVAIRVIDAIWRVPIEHRLIDFDRSVDEVDLIAHARDGQVRLEAKAHMLDRRKSWFLINERAHERSQARGAEAYVPIVTRLGADRALVGSLLSAAEVSEWSPPRLTLRDPARGQPLETFLPERFDGTTTQLEAELPTQLVVAEDELQLVSARASTDFERWRELLPRLDGMRASTIRDAVISTRDRIAAEPQT